MEKLGLQNTVMPPVFSAVVFFPVSILLEFSKWPLQKPTFIREFYKGAVFTWVWALWSRQEIAVMLTQPFLGPSFWLKLRQVVGEAFFSFCYKGKVESPGCPSAVRLGN